MHRIILIFRQFRKGIEKSIKGDSRLIANDGVEVHSAVELPGANIRFYKPDGKFKHLLGIHFDRPPYRLCGVMTGAGERSRASRLRNHRMSLCNQQTGGVA